MKTALPFIALLAGCPNPDDNGNPDVLWLALDGRETEVKLVAEQPNPF